MTKSDDEERMTISSVIYLIEGLFRSMLPHWGFAAPAQDMHAAVRLTDHHCCCLDYLHELASCLNEAFCCYFLCKKKIKQRAKKRKLFTLENPSRSLKCKQSAVQSLHLFVQWFYSKSYLDYYYKN